MIPPEVLLFSAVAALNLIAALGVILSHRMPRKRRASETAVSAAAPQAAPFGAVLEEAAGLLREATPAPAPRERSRGEAKLVEDIARWRRKAGLRDSAPVAATASRPARSAIADEPLLAAIRDVVAGGEQPVPCARVHRELRLRGVRVSRARIAKIMRGAGLATEPAHPSSKEAPMEPAVARADGAPEAASGALPTGSHDSPEDPRSEDWWRKLASFLDDCRRDDSLSGVSAEEKVRLLERSFGLVLRRDDTARSTTRSSGPGREVLA